ncbi:uncharacterized protein YALI1_F32901g [Yarrowia lipolytica]|uniref:Uncharacterized protein n=1 Tax=Yarrowia lipolytica TaxID=4952 RepID=A0A1D8NPY6_YARLL|nr:hypothetical protein YALI1_F32901g [Yarrowia lipolytica]
MLVLRGFFSLGGFACTPSTLHIAGVFFGLNSCVIAGAFKPPFGSFWNMTLRQDHLVKQTPNCSSCWLFHPSLRPI